MGGPGPSRKSLPWRSVGTRACALPWRRFSLPLPDRVAGCPRLVGTRCGMPVEGKEWPVV